MTNSKRNLFLTIFTLLLSLRAAGSPGYEFSIKQSSGHISVLDDIARMPGLETLEFDTLISKQDQSSFIDNLFNTPFVVPHFCYALEELDPWMPAQDLSNACRSIILSLISPYLEGGYVLKTFKIQGATPDHDYTKAKLLAQNPRTGINILFSFDVIIE